VLPAKWKTRLVRVEAGETLGWCLAPVDLAVSKIIAGREKDIGFVRGMLRSGFITEFVIQSVVGELKPSNTDIVLKRLPLCR